MLHALPQMRHAGGVPACCRDPAPAHSHGGALGLPLERRQHAAAAAIAAAAAGARRGGGAGQLGAALLHALELRAHVIRDRGKVPVQLHGVHMRRAWGSHGARMGRCGGWRATWRRMEAACKQGRRAADWRRGGRGSHSGAQGAFELAGGRTCAFALTNALFHSLVCWLGAPPPRPWRALAA